MRVVGLMSGTSLDGIDAVLLEIEAGDPVGWRVDAFVTVPYPPERRRAILAAMEGGSPDALARLHARLGEWLAEAALAVCRSAGVEPGAVDVIGSHGQTVWHRPPEPGARGFTLQLGDPATVAERTGIPVVADFRSRDMAAGGEGAPLVPWVDRLLFSGPQVRVLVNIGGMANLTRLPRRGSTAPLVAFDTGPGNAIIDVAMEAATDGARLYDANGEWARRGRVDHALLEELLADPYFQRPPPKSTGRESFGRRYVKRIVAARRPADRAEWAGLVATLTELVAATVSEGVRRWAPPGEDGEVFITGGGGENPVLVERIRSELDPVPVHAGDALGVDPGAKEAVAFAVLAWAHVAGRPASVPDVTGAAGPRVLGSLTPGADGPLPGGGR